MGRLLEVYNTRDILGLRSGPVSCQRVGLFIAPSITLWPLRTSDLRPRCLIWAKLSHRKNRVDIFENIWTGSSTEVTRRRVEYEAAR